MTTPSTPQAQSEPFPNISTPPSPKTPQGTGRKRDGSNTSSLTGRLRSASKTFAESSPPVGFCVATGQAVSNLPNITDIRRGNYDSDGWSGEGQIIEKERRSSLSRRGSAQNTPTSPKDKAPFRNQTVPEVPEGGESVPMHNIQNPSSSNEHTTTFVVRSSSDTNATPLKTQVQPETRTEPFDNGYEFPPKHTWKESTIIGSKATWKFVTTPVGFLITIYGLNVVAWGGMLFLLLCNASPAMCKPTCNDINSPRRIWIEIDSQILNALFCVTGFGTIPWRFRDLYYLMQYRVQKKELGLRRLAGINRGWFRLAGSQELPVDLGPLGTDSKVSSFHEPQNRSVTTTTGTQLTGISESSIPYPITKIPNAPLTGIRAPPTKMWKLDFVIWAMVWNTFLQAVLSGFMWGLNRYDRPSWSTGLFVALACIVAACGGIMSFIEGKHVKAIEGVPVSEVDMEKLKRDREMGIVHWNNIKAEKPKEKKAKKGKGEEEGGGVFSRREKIAEGVAVDRSAMREGAAQIVK